MPRKPVVIVTGSSGFIGAALCERLRGTFHVIGFDRPGGGEPPPEVEAVDCDLASDASVAAAFEKTRELAGTRIASVLHLAAYYDFAGAPSPLYDEITVRGTARLLTGLRDFDLDQFVFSSTMLVHAPTEPGKKITEDSPLDPKWDYPKSKVETEELITSFPGDFRRVLLRISGVYDDRCHSIPIAHQIERIYERSLLARVFPGDVSHGQTFLHLDDLTDAFERVVRRRTKLASPLVLLLGEPETTSYDELQRAISRLLNGEELETKRVPKAVAKAGTWMQEVGPGEEPFIKPWMIDLADDHFELDIRRARRVLGWTPKHRLLDTLPEMIAALLANPTRWYRENKLGAPPEELSAPSPSA